MAGLLTVPPNLIGSFGIRGVRLDGPAEGKHKASPYRWCQPPEIPKTHLILGEPQVKFVVWVQHTKE